MMTSAPKCARSWPQKGPAISWPSSRTFTPERGPGLESWEAGEDGVEESVARDRAIGG